MMELSSSFILLSSSKVLKDEMFDVIRSQLGKAGILGWGLREKVGGGRRWI